jgi:hypothetical protein
MARTKSLSVESLAPLGVDALAALLISHAEEDAALRKKLKLLLAGTEGTGKLAAEISKRIQTIGRSRSMIDWEKRKTVVQELTHLRVTAATTLAAQNPKVAIGLLWDFIALADGVMNRLGEPGPVEDIFDAAMADLGRLLAAEPDLDRTELARRVQAICDGGGFGASGSIISHLSAALGVAGRAALRQAATAALHAVPHPKGKNDWAANVQKRRLGFRLTLLADLDQDVDAFIAAARAGGLEESLRHAIAGRLLTASRPAEALQWLDAPRAAAGPRFGGGEDEEDATESDLRAAALDALGDVQAAQLCRWAYFERALSVRHLRDYLKRLPDFEDFDAEMKALDIAAAHKNAPLALHFFIEWPALDRADLLIRDRLKQLDGRFYELLRPAADMLAGKYPEAATLLYRSMVESVLARGSSTQYRYAMQDLLSCAHLAPHLPENATIETHPTFIARLKKAHGKKYSFWELAGEPI